MPTPPPRALPRGPGGGRGRGPYRHHDRPRPAASTSHASAASSVAAAEVATGPREVELSLPISIKDFSAAIGIKIPQLLGYCLREKLPYAITSTIDDEDHAQLIGLAFGKEVKVKERKDEEADLLAFAAVNVFQLAKPDTDALRAFADVDSIGGVGALLAGEFDKRGGLFAGSGGRKHGGAVRLSIR